MYYRCGLCHREILFPNVEYVSEIDGNRFILAHKCPCSPGRVFEDMCEVEHEALRRMLGGFRPALPYRAAPGKAFPLPPKMERQVLIFAWDLAQVTDVDEFLLFCSRPATS